MQTIFLLRPWSAFAGGMAVAGLVLALWLFGARGDALGLASMLARFVHLFAAMLWVGMIWFVNFIQLAALQDTDDAGRAALLQRIVPAVAKIIRFASHIVVASGVGLLLTNGYVLDRWVFPSSVYIPSFRGGLMWGGVAAGLVMWALVHFTIWPALQVVLDAGAELPEKAAARARIRLAARINLLLSVPVTFVMIAAAHLY